MRKLEREFYMSDAVAAARNLIGCTLFSVNEDGAAAGRIVETEAYMGPEDTAAHSCRGNPSGRTRVLYGEKGHAYIYLIYGMYCCLNLSAGPEGVPQCVLIRALEPVEGIELMTRRRGTDAARKLCGGPGRLCRALGITLEDYGCDLTGGRLYILSRDIEPPIDASPRINIDYAEGYIDKPWRFTLRDSAFLSVEPKQNKRPVSGR